MPNSRKFGFLKRARILAKSNNLCWYCGCGFEVDADEANAPCLDHVVPKSKGGSHEDENLVASCRSCNSRKGSRSLEEYRASLLRNQPEYRAICFLSAALEEASTPFDQDLLKTIQYLQGQVTPISFYGETLAAPEIWGRAS